jgi:hypothetical protein
MDYNLVRTVPTEIDQEYAREGNEFGDIPSDILMSKFEETDLGEDEDAFDNFARGTLMDQRPDQNKFEHEESRGAVSRRSGYLNLIHGGNRGNVDYSHVYKPEMFLGEDSGYRDPRGNNVDPDMKELRKQENARMRFIRWTADGSDHVTGGHRSDDKVMQDQQTLFKITRDRLKVFERQLDGRTPQTSRAYKKKSDIPKQILVQSYGDYLRDYALNPQRRANIICKQVLRDSRTYRDECAEAEFEVAKYSQLCRRAQTRTAHRAISTAQMGSDAKFADADTSKCFKAAGLLMANIIRGKRQYLDSVKNSDMDFSETKNTVARKTEPFARDLALILKSIAVDSEFATGDMTMITKTATPTIMEHLARQIVYNHVAPAHHYLNAEVLYKSVKPGADTRKIKDQIITDANAPELRDLNTVAGKTAKLKMVSGAKLKTTDDAEKQESFNTVNYKRKLDPNGDRRIRVTSGEDYKKESDNSQNRRPNHTNYRNPNANDNTTGIEFLDNASKERHTAAMGTKYMNRFIDRDSTAAETFGNN